MSTIANSVSLGNCIIVPLRLREQVLGLLHDGHPGIVKMKMLARLHFYWPGINQDIEGLVLSCAPCQMIQNVPKIKDLGNWNPVNRVCERAHTDISDFKRKKILIIVGPHSK